MISDLWPIFDASNLSSTVLARGSLFRVRVDVGARPVVFFFFTCRTTTVAVITAAPMTATAMMSGIAIEATSFSPADTTGAGVSAAGGSVVGAVEGDAFAGWIRDCSFPHAGLSHPSPGSLLVGAYVNVKLSEMG